MKNILIIIVLSFMNNGYCWSQSTHNVINIPLSEPGEKGLLKLDVSKGKIIITGTDRSDVQIEFNKNSKSKKIKKGNVKKVSSALMDVDITKEKNTIDVKGGDDQANYFIEVPYSFDLSVYSYHGNSHIKITGVTGEIDVEAYEGDISLVNVGGAIIAETYYGKINAVINEIYENKPMAFTSYYGNIEVEFPDNSDCLFKMRSATGKVFTDFDLSFEADPSTEENKIKVGGWVYATSGKGGKVYMLTNYFGDIVVKKSK